MTRRIFADLYQLLRFVQVGAAATALHVSVSVILVTWVGFSNQRANFVAFVCAFALSFLGHYHWSFKSNRPYRQVLPRFILVSVAGYLASIPAIEFLSFIFSQNFLVVTLGSLAVPAVSYAANRWFVFR